MGLSSAGFGEAAGHEEDGGDVDPGLVVGGESFVVAGAAAPPGGPGVGALDDPAAGQDLEALLVLGLFDDFDGDAELAFCPVAPVAVVALPAQTWASRWRPAARARLRVSAAPARSWAFAAVTATAMSSPMVSVSRCRLRPLTFL